MAFYILRGLCLCYSVHTRADQLLAQLLMEQFDTLNICMKEFGLEKIIFDKMKAVRT